MMRSLLISLTGKEEINCKQRRAARSSFSLSLLGQDLAARDLGKLIWLCGRSHARAGFLCATLVYSLSPKQSKWMFPYRLNRAARYQWRQRQRRRKSLIRARLSPSVRAGLATCRLPIEQLTMLALDERAWPAVGKVLFKWLHLLLGRLRVA